jgi:hypothetical protein
VEDGVIQFIAIADKIVATDSLNVIHRSNWTAG